MIVEEIAAEIEPSAAFCLGLNAAPSHIFCDNKQVKPKADVFCYVHQAKCKVSEGGFDIFCSGFSCKGNSKHNAKRWAEDPVSESEHFASFEDVETFIKQFSPMVVILENVQGMLMPRQKGEDMIPSWILCFLDLQNCLEVTVSKLFRLIASVFQIHDLVCT